MAASNATGNDKPDKIRKLAIGSNSSADKPDKPPPRKEGKREKKSAADRREELLKQLKAVENAIAKKRTKIEGR